MLVVVMRVEVAMKLRAVELESRMSIERLGLRIRVKKQKDNHL